MKRTKLGNGYWQDGYGKGFKKSPVIWLINGKAYAKDGQRFPYETDLSGYVMVNYNKPTNPEYEGSFYEVGLISQHKQHQD